MNSILRLLTAAVLICSNTANAMDLKKIDRMNPINEAKKVASEGGVFFIGLYGYALMVPGVPGNPYCWKNSGLVKVIPNTSDALLTAEDAQWQNLAGKFSEAFNTKLLELEPDLASHKCAHNN